MGHEKLNADVNGDGGANVKGDVKGDGGANVKGDVKGDGGANVKGDGGAIGLIQDDVNISQMDALCTNGSGV